MFRILVAYKISEEGLRRLEEATDVAYDVRPGLSKAELLAIVPEYDALIVGSDTAVDAELLAAGKRLKVVGRAGASVDNIDVESATLRGIIVMNTPGATSIALAEHTLALMLVASRGTAHAHAALLKGEWQRSQHVGTELFGKVLGIIGFGSVGRQVAQRAKAFGMDVIACDPFVSEEVGREQGVLLVDIDELLAQADYITLHTPMLEETQNVINAETIAQMKDGVTLINVSRGKLVEERALADALRSGKVRAAGVDVFQQEPPTPDNPLIGLPNVVHTPHLGAGTLEAQRVVAVKIVDQVLAAVRGTDFANSINMPFQAREDFGRIRPYLTLGEKLGALHAGLADQPIKRIEIEVKGDIVGELVRAIAAAILKGLLGKSVATPINYINAPLLADQHGITINQTTGINGLDYQNLVSCRAIWDEEERTLAGVLFGGSEPRLVQVDQYRLEARPEGVVLMMQNRDVPGVIGQVGTILAAYDVNIGEWRLGRDAPGGQALSFINLDSVPPPAVIDALGGITAVTRVKLVILE